jgi:TM2 domain-containing membrane protein YozV
MDYMQQPNEPYGQLDPQAQPPQPTQLSPTYGASSSPVQSQQSPYPISVEAQPQQPQYGLPAQMQAQPQYQQPQYEMPQSQPQYQQSAYTVPSAQPYGASQPMMMPVQQKSKLAAGLLGIFLGCFGAHNFYLGNYGKAVAQLLLTLLLGWFFGLGVVASGIWSLVEGILILSSAYGSQWHRDATGVELRD